ncbi:hypothetical protein D3C81_1998400 [compost metagenome]
MRITHGRHWVKSMPRSTVSSWPSTSIFRKWIARPWACSSQMEVRVRDLIVWLRTSMPASMCILAMAGSRVERPVPAMP